MEYEGHKVILTKGYYDVYFPEHPNARKNGSVMLQVLVAEKILGRYLHKGEVVHHKDLNKLNNNPENLMVFGSLADHANYHAFVLSNKNYDYVLYKVANVYYCQSVDDFFNQNDIINKNGRKLKPCPMCGKLITRHSSLCTKCKGLACRKVERPSRNVLRNDLKHLSFVKIGLKYGVTDNAVRKWCKSYGLPYKASDIRLITGNMWDKL